MYAQHLLTLILCIIPVVVSPAPVGTITAQDNAPGTIERQKTHINAAKGTGIEMQDAVNTINGKLLITFRDDTKVEINEQSRLEIDDFVFDPNTPSAGKLAMNFAQGTVRYASGAIAHNNPSKVSINTPTATVSVRGTDFTATVDELGSSTVILLPSCPAGFRNIETDCKTGVIDVSNVAGTVTLNKPFQGTQVLSRNQPPTKPVILHLTGETINNLLIISAPPEIKAAVLAASSGRSGLDTNFLDENFLENVFALVGNPLLNNPYNQLPIDLPTQHNNELHRRLPDWKKPTGVVATLSSTAVGLCRPDAGSTIQCVTVPITQNTTVLQTQGSTNVANRVNTGGNTLIILKQN